MVDMQSNIKTIYLAGGCFWGVEAYFEKVSGVVKTTVGYANGIGENPTYEEVCTGKTNFAESVKVEYFPEKVSTEKILLHFFNVVDPTSLNKQAHDEGTQYRSGIFYIDEDDKIVMQRIIVQEQEKYTMPIVTEVKRLENFYEAEEYHQKYLDKNPQGYCHIDFSKLKDIN